ncbi:Uncharacterised protein [Shigella sonnei]|nr:Uncharacterised protein [Shigella sonnei]
MLIYKLLLFHGGYSDRFNSGLMQMNDVARNYLTIDN